MDFMNGQSSDMLSQQRLALAPGDEVARYVEGKPIFCTVVEVVDAHHIVIEADLWPRGYTALVHTHDVSLVSRKA